MKTINFGEQMPNSGSNFLKVKQKGDQIKFRIAQQPVYEAKHFIQVADKWDVTPCDRINNGETCSYCELYFQGLDESKKLKDTNKEEAEKWEKDSRKYRPSTTFYFPVLNRDTEQFGILQTTPGVRKKLNDQFEAGVDIMAKDWILRNTGSTTPSELYSLIPVDSADTKPFSDKEKEEFKKAENFDMMSINGGNAQQDDGLPF